MLHMPAEPYVQSHTSAISATEKNELWSKSATQTSVQKLYDYPQFANEESLSFPVNSLQNKR
jgi:hypothetical protein